MPFLESFWRRLPLWLLLFGRLHVKLSLGLPTATPVASAVQDAHTALPTLMTVYGFLDSVHQDETLPSGRPALAHLSKVFIAMTQTDAAAMPFSTNPSELVQDVPLIESPLPSPIVEQVTISTPPKQGPGLVMLSSQVLGPTSQPTATGNTASSSTTASHSTSSSRVVVLGSVIGGILAVTLCLFFLLGPKKNRQLFLCFRRQSSSSARNGKQEKGISSDSFSSGSVLRKMNLRPSGAVEKSGLESVKEKNTVTQGHTRLPPPTKKASIASTEYLSCSPRESAISSASESSTVKALGAATPPPVRPPRPPTADSPALSDSVFLACSDKPFVIVAPQPLSEADLHSLPDSSKILTPEEFLMMHVPEVLSGLPSLASKLNDHRDGTAFGAPVERRLLHAGNRSSGHARTRSEPTYDAERNSKSSDGASEDDEDSVVRSSFVQRLIQHRRSRSASGWAYPDHLRSRKRKAERNLGLEVGC